MQKANWNQYLSSNNPWTKRLIGLESFSRQRNLKQIEREYNQDKYGTLRKFEFTDIETYKIKERELAGLGEKNNIFFSIGEELFEASCSFAFSIYHSLVSNTIKKYNPERICELGCGYGYNFSYLKNICSQVYGGEYSENAVTIAHLLGLDIQKFNYYNLNEYSLIKSGSLVLTSHSIEQLPTAQCFIDGMYRNRHKIDLIVNFEPSYLNERQSLIGILRNRYIEINDYNQDLISLLKSRNDIEIVEFKPEAIGVNPLNSANILVWKFK